MLRIRRTSVVSVLAVALAVAGCGSAESDVSPTPVPADTTGSGAWVRCDEMEPVHGEVINPAAPALAPTDNGPESLQTELRTYAARFRATFAGIWIDRSNGTFTIAFTDSVGERIEELVPIVGDQARVAVAHATFTEAELLEAIDTIGESGLEGSGVVAVGIPTNYNVASVMVPILTEDAVRSVLDAVGDLPLCFEGADPADAIPEGPQPTEGDGWRLVLDEPGVGLPYRTGFAGSPTELGELWAAIGTDAPLPDVDWATESIVYFGPAVSGSCPDIRLDAVIFDSEGSMVRPEIVLPGGAAVCTSDANPHAYVVVVPTDRLPERPFTVELFVDACATAPGVCEEQRTTVE